MADFDKSHRMVTNQLQNYSQNSSRKDSSNGQIAHEAISVISENPLEISPIVGHSNPMLRDFEEACELVERPKHCLSRLSSPYRGTQFTTVHWVGEQIWET